MGARQRLNSLYLVGVLIIAAIIGTAADSWLVFLLTAAILTGMLIHDGGIRPGPTHPRRFRRRR